MKRIFYYLLKIMAFLSRLFSYKLYMRLICTAHKSQGVKFIGMPEYIQQDAYLDASGRLTISKGVEISTNVIILTHDWSYLKRSNEVRESRHFKPFKPVEIGENSFIGAGAIILPGSTIGSNCIIGAGAVVKGRVGSFNIVAGNPAKVLGRTNTI